MISSEIMTGAETAGEVNMVFSFQMVLTLTL